MGGYNTEITHNGLAFHIQTQDQGAGAHYIETMVYCSGRVISSRKSSYTHLLHQKDREGLVLRLIEDQHAEVISDIKAGKLDHL